MDVSQPIQETTPIKEPFFQQKFRQYFSYSFNFKDYLQNGAAIRIAVELCILLMVIIYPFATEGTFPAWVQAIGSISAIIMAALVVVYANAQETKRINQQYERQIKDERHKLLKQKQTEITQFILLLIETFRIYQKVCIQFDEQTDERPSNAVVAQDLLTMVDLMSLAARFDLNNLVKSKNKAKVITYINSFKAILGIYFKKSDSNSSIRYISVIRLLNTYSKIDDKVNLSQTAPTFKVLKGDLPEVIQILRFEKKYLASKYR